MYCVRNVTEDLYWVGANDHRLHLFENIHPIPRGVSYNAYLLLDEQTALFGGFDHNMVLSGRHAAELSSPETGIVMDVYTTLPGMQLYTANSLTERAGKRGATMGRHGGICLETQLHPDGMNHYGFPSPILHPGEHLHTATLYAFMRE